VTFFIFNVGFNIIKREDIENEKMDQLRKDWEEEEEDNNQITKIAEEQSENDSVNDDISDAVFEIREKLRK
jgi:hypothetical protein